MSDMWVRITERADAKRALISEMAAVDAEARAIARYYPEERAMNNNDVIDTLKQAGFRIRVQHLRYYHLNKAGDITKRRHLLPTQAPRARAGRALGLMDANGGVTKCLLLQTTRATWNGRLITEGEHLGNAHIPIAGRFAEGTAHCATDDPFNRSQGVRFALRDALQNLNLSFIADERQHVLLVRCIEQLEQVENEYQEDIRLRGEASAVQHMHDDERWGAVRHMSEINLKRLSREERLTQIGAERERIEMLRQHIATPETIETPAY